MSGHGGKRINSGRKKKEDKEDFLNLMDAMAAPVEVWDKLAERVRIGDTQALKLWLAYRYGQPKQSVDHTTKGDKIEGERVVFSFKKEKNK